VDAQCDNLATIVDTCCPEFGDKVPEQSALIFGDTQILV